MAAVSTVFERVCRVYGEAHKLHWGEEDRVVTCGVLSVSFTSMLSCNEAVAIWWAGSKGQLVCPNQFERVLTRAEAVRVPVFKTVYWPPLDAGNMPQTRPLCAVSCPFIQ